MTRNVNFEKIQQNIQELKNVKACFIKYVLTSTASQTSADYT